MSEYIEHLLRQSERYAEPHVVFDSIAKDYRVVVAPSNIQRTLAVCETREEAERALVEVKQKGRQ